MDRLAPGKVLTLRFHLEQQLGSARSLTGAQLDQLRRGWAPPAQGAHPDPQQHLRLQYLDLLALCRDLTEQETQVCRLRYATPAGTESYDRSVPAADVARQPWGQGAPDLGTTDGEVMLPHRVAARLGATQPDRLLVRGTRARWPSYQEIAQQLGLSARQVETRLSAALSKVARRLTARRESEQAYQSA